MYDRQKTIPFFQASLGISVRKVSNGYSVKINHSIFPEEIGRIIVADGKERCFEILDALFTACDAAPKTENDTRGNFYGNSTDCGDPSVEPS